MESTQPRTAGLIGVALGFLSLAAGLLHFYAGPLEPQPTVEDFVQEKTKSIRDAMIAGLKGEAPEAAEPEERTYSRDDIAKLTIIGLGIASIGFALIAFLRREDATASWLALVFGAGGITLNFAIAALGAVLGILLLGAIIISVGMALGGFEIG